MAKTKCFHCNKKIGLVKYDCNCGKCFCSLCRYPEKHKCTFDFNKDFKNKLENKLIKVVNEKIIKI